MYRQYVQQKKILTVHLSLIKWLMKNKERIVLLKNYQEKKQADSKAKERKLIHRRESRLHG